MMIRHPKKHADLDSAVATVAAQLFNDPDSGPWTVIYDGREYTAACGKGDLELGERIVWCAGKVSA
jgi:hypothetical protein